MFDKLFHPVMCSRVFVNYKNDDIENFYDLYGTKYVKELVFYLRYTILEVAFGGVV